MYISLGLRRAYLARNRSPLPALYPLNSIQGCMLHSETRQSWRPGRTYFGDVRCMTTTWCTQTSWKPAIGSSKESATLMELEIAALVPAPRLSADRLGGAVYHERSHPTVATRMECRLPLWVSIANIRVVPMGSLLLCLHRAQLSTRARPVQMVAHDGASHVATLQQQFWVQSLSRCDRQRQAKREHSNDSLATRVLMNRSAG
jgi:hypothetical protein